MTFTERCALCQKLRDGYDAELMGLRQAKLDLEFGRRDKTNYIGPHERLSRFEQGYREGREILRLEAGQKGEL